ncbi:response regulator [Marinomonas mediterranea]|uniref:Two component transcriptional regulator, winged helix family n=1 Tax=Marinomonas mediterranea (strain ATCC 700492 / JCM 21426 / NBRC 103028 / MMB-1) TaxID=717774 RepID=F2JXB2_MARM1|nr:response regulator [Marinomonas mediterranea]ADZ90718.1 two component transcriptional regulator, winged helix family [Marinomonas mediterranea MMB-1]WCN08765.1 response regulator [Marinomonas mediterranea]WCN12810.1 response regulator [Marinomonas mediterranea]WCN16879.1 response regulator [Marinomonas mediterranea MMB-1]
MSKVLIVEDEPKLAELMSAYLEQAGYEHHHLERGDIVVDYVKSNQVDLILLDLMLPGLDGIEVCKQVRQFSGIPIIMVTAKAEEIDRLIGLEMGADDYVCKPFSPREVVARVKANLRRVELDHIESPKTDGFDLDADRLRATYKGELIDLTTVEFQLLQLLIKEPGRVFGRDLIMKSIYSDSRVVSDRTIDSHIKKLRKKISAVAPELNVIHSVYGAGYRFENND